MKKILAAVAVGAMLTVPVAVAPHADAAKSVKESSWGCPPATC